MTLEVVPWRGHRVPVLARDEVSRASLEEYVSWVTQAERYMGPPMPTTTYGMRPAEPVSYSFEGFVQGLLYADGPVAAAEAYRLRVFGQAPLLYQEMVDGRAGDMFDDPQLDRLRKPWPGGTLSDLMKRTLLYGDFAGNAFIADLEDELVLLRPDWVEIVLAKREYRGGQVGWKQVGIAYYEGGLQVGDPVVFLPGEYSHFVPGLPDPLATYRGMSWLTPIVREVRADKAASDHKLAFFENAASPNLAVSLPKEITPTQFRDFVDKMDDQHRGTFNAYKCLHPDTAVSMWDGSLRRAGEVVVGDVVVAWADGKAAPGAVSAVDEQFPSPIVTVRTQRGRVIKTNDRHPFLLKDGSWVNAIDLNYGDLLVAGLGFAHDDVSDSLTPYQAWVLGVIVGDGCTVSSTPVVSAWDEGVRTRLSIGHQLNSTGKGHDYRVLGVRALTVSAGIMSKRAWEKRIPSAVMAGSTKIKAAFLSGLVDTDGHVSDPAYRRSAEVGITSTSELLLRDAQHLLASLGVNASLSLPMPAGQPGGGAGGHTPRVHDAWRLIALGNDQARRLVELLDLACTPKAERLAMYAATPSRQDRSRFDRVVSVEVGAAEVTIGLEVAGHHTHVTGGVVTHNTLYTAGGADVTVIGANMQQMDFGAVQGKGETRIANAAGVSPVLLSFSEGMQGSSLNSGNYTAAKRNFVDSTCRDLWGNFAGSVEQMDAFTPPRKASRLTIDGRDIPFLHEDSKDLAGIQQTRAATINSYITAGWEPDSAVEAVAQDDVTVLKHTGAFSVQLQPPGTGADADGDGIPDDPAADEYAAALEEFRADLAWRDEIRRGWEDQVRDPGGEDGGQWVSMPGLDKDALKLAGRMDLAPGEELVGSGKLSTDNGPIVMALTSGPAGRRLRVGFVEEGDERSWRGRNLGSTAIFDEAGAAKFREGLSEMLSAGAEAEVEAKRLNDAYDTLRLKQRGVIRRQYKGLNKQQARALDRLDERMGVIENRLRNLLADRADRDRRMAEPDADVKFLQGMQRMRDGERDSITAEHARLASERAELAGEGAPLTASDQAEIAALDGQIAAALADLDRVGEVDLVGGSIGGEWGGISWAVETDEMGEPWYYLERPGSDDRMRLERGDVERLLRMLATDVARADVVRKFDPDQLRDMRGRWARQFMEVLHVDALAESYGEELDAVDLDGGWRVAAHPGMVSIQAPDDESDDVGVLLSPNPDEARGLADRIDELIGSSESGVNANGLVDWTIDDDVLVGVRESGDIAVFVVDEDDKDRATESLSGFVGMDFSADEAADLAEGLREMADAAEATVERRRGPRRRRSRRDLWRAGDYYDIRVRKGAVGGGRFRKLSDIMVDRLNDWLSGDLDDEDPLEPFNREQLRKVSKELGVEPRRGASAEELKLGLLKDARRRVREARDNPPPKPSAKFASGRRRNVDVAVYREANGRVSLYEESDAGRRGARVAIADDLAGLESWAREHGEPAVADWARKERGEASAKKAAPRKAPAKRTPAKKAAPAKVAPATKATIPPAVHDVVSLRDLDTEARREALDDMKLDQIKPILKAEGLSVSGRKRDLVDRLVSHLDGDPMTSQIEAAYERLLGRRRGQDNRWVHLADLRREMGEHAADRGAVDVALDQMIVRPEVWLMAELNQQTLTPERRAAAVRIGSEDRHLLKIEPAAKSIPAPAPTALPQEGTEVAELAGRPPFSARDAEVAAALKGKTPVELRRVADAMNITIPPRVRNQSAIVNYLVQTANDLDGRVGGNGNVHRRLIEAATRGQTSEAAAPNPDGLDAMSGTRLKSYAAEWLDSTAGMDDAQLRAALRREDVGSPEVMRERREAEEAARPAPTPPPATGGGLPNDPAVRMVEIQNRIRATYQRIAFQAPTPPTSSNPDGNGVWVRLADLRRELSDIPREDLNAALILLNRSGDGLLTPESNQKALKLDDQASAVIVGQQYKDLFLMTHAGVQIRDLPDADPSARPWVRSQPGPLSADPAVRAEQLRDRLTAAAQRFRARIRAEPMIAELRAEMGDVSKTDFENAVRAGVRSGLLSVLQDGPGDGVKVGQQNVTRVVVNLAKEDADAMAIIKHATQSRRQPSTPAVPTVRPTPAPASAGQMSSKAILPNHWGTRGGEIHFHDDGAIGTALKRMGDDRSLDIDGEPLANVLGRLATDGVQGRKTSEQVVDGLRAIRDRLPLDSKARRELDSAIVDLDAPPRAVTLPAGTPGPLRDLMDALLRIPLARRTEGQFGQAEENEVDKLAEIAQQFADGKTGGQRLISAVRNALMNTRHESVEGKFEIDRAVRSALDALETIHQDRSRRAELMPGPKADGGPASPRPARTGSYTGPRYELPANVDRVALADLRRRLDQSRPAGSARHAEEQLGRPDAETRRLIDRLGPTVAGRVAWESDVAAAMARLVESHGANEQQFRAAAAARLRGDVAGAKVAIRVTPESLGAVLAEGRFRSQFEVAERPGRYSREQRREAEAVMFGLASDVDPATRPIYGYMAVDGVDSTAPDALDVHGDVRVVFRDSVRGRTTATVGDSLDQRILPSPVDDPTWESFNPGVHGNRRLSPDGLSLDYGAARLYVEAQIHGGVNASDIAEVVFTAEPSPTLKRRLAERGIPWRVTSGEVERWDPRQLRHRRGTPHGGRFAKDPDADPAPETKSVARRPRHRSGETKRKKPAKDLFAHFGDRERRPTPELRDIFEGTFAGGFRTELVQAEVGAQRIGVEGEIFDAEGRKVGDFARAVAIDRDGNLYAVHSLLSLDSDVRGQGFAAEFNASLIDWYRQSDVGRVELHANIDVGGYSWARAGYDFRDGKPSEDVMERLRDKADIRMPTVADYDSWEVEDDDDAEQYGLPAGTRGTVVQDKDGKTVHVGEDHWEAGRWIRQAVADAEVDWDAAARQSQYPEVVDVLRRIHQGEHVTAYEISQLGRLESDTGHEALWPGKEILLGSDWRGVRWL